MSRERRTFIFGGACVAILACATCVIVISRASTNSLDVEQATQARTPQRRRNLALQPETAAVNRRLGNRFRSSRTQSVLSGTITIAGNAQPATIIRRQTENGETVEVVMPGRRLSWNDVEGTKAVHGVPAETERLLVERLVFDSPDQFVLAQLRGASYQTIFRNLRPTDAGDNYDGPIWTVVRIGEPQAAAAFNSESRWRLYYINTDTGLIDRVESEVNGQKIEAAILKWSEQNGEQLPSHIRWTANGQTLMEYHLTAFSHK